MKFNLIDILIARAGLNWIGGVRIWTICFSNVGYREE